MIYLIKLNVIFYKLKKFGRATITETEMGFYKEKWLTGLQNVKHIGPGWARPG